VEQWVLGGLVLLPALPFTAAAVLAFLPRAMAARVSAGFSLATLLVAVALAAAVFTAPAGQVWQLGQGVLSLRLDPLALVMGLLVASISLVVTVYSARYMADEPGYSRFFALLGLMTSVILLLVTAADLYTLLIAWFLVGVVLFFLLGHDTTRPAAGRYALWTFLTYRLADVPMVAAALLLGHAYATTDLAELFARVAADPGVQWGGVPVVGTAAMLVALAAFARSAQFPLHTWLPYSMEGPTPVSALMHAGIVNAGGFLFNRFAPLFVHTPNVLHVVFVVGLVTALIGSALMLMQNDVKKSLGYSTMGQMGFMVMEVGLGAFSLAVYHLIAHGLFKATLFLGAGGVIGEARRHDGVPADDLYTFVVEQRPARPARLPWLAVLLMTVCVPALVLGIAHFLVVGDLAHKQGAIVLLFFGWVAGAQVFFSVHRMPSEQPWRTMWLILLSFVVIVVGYTLLGHVVERFLYPDSALSGALYAAAGIDLVVFDLLVIVLTLILAGTWILTLYADRIRFDGHPGSKRHRFYVGLYALLSRELYVADIYAWCARVLVDAARRVNLGLRWL
jgi:NADH-quinone oxidoreductase subunit L